MELGLTAEDVGALERRTEGWIAALQLAALSMQGRDDLAGFIARFAGDDRYIVDYLVEKVLQRQPEHVRSFLLQTCILGRLSGPLCDAVTGQADGKPCWRRWRRWRRWSAGTCSWSRSTIAAAGTDTTISSRTFFSPTCGRNTRTMSLTCTGARASGLNRTANALRRSATPLPLRTSTAQPASSSSRREQRS
jgi:hypothetical protein